MKVIIASNNQGKIREYKQILEKFGYEVLSQKEAGIDIEVEETGKSYMENARLKAEAVYKLTNASVLADDSGLSIDFLNGGPGLYTARFKQDMVQAERNKYVLDEMKNEENRSARFVTSICFIYENNKKRIEVEGICEGNIARLSKGENGFGYDPIFIPEGYDKTMAEISLEEKNKISSRGKATKLLEEKLSNK